MIKRPVDMLLRFGMTAAVVLFACTASTVDNGGSSGTEVSAAAGTVFDRDGNPLAGAVVRLRPSDFLGDSSQSESYLRTHSIADTVTGADGTYNFVNIAPGDYMVEVVKDDSLGACAAFTAGPQPDTVTVVALSPERMAMLTGSVQMNYGSSAAAIVQAYGIARSAMTDANGNFSLYVPQGKHTFNIRAFDDDTTLDEVDEIDVTLEVFAGERRDAGSFRLRPPPPPACTSGACDSAVVRMLLDGAGYASVPLSSVSATDGGRIVELNLRGKNLEGIIPFEINRLVKLRLLDLGDTRLLGMFPFIGRMVDLEIVRLDGNDMPVFASTIDGCVKLRELDLAGNAFTYLAPSLIRCPKIELLDVGGNRLCGIDEMVALWIDTYDKTWRTNQRCQ